MQIVGRQREIKIFKQILSSKEAEFVAVYGRRRVGKTFLIQNCCSQFDFYMECTGIKDGKLKDQLQNFTKSFSKTFYPGLILESPKNWREAFEMVTRELKKIPKSKEVILFFDELPWLASIKSKFMQNLDYFWNTEWVHFPNLKLIVCGSAASWMLSNLINAKGGLYNRLTRSILLNPFTLNETKEFLEKRGLRFTNKQALEIYMIMGGIPYYLKHLEKSKSIAQNINALCFRKDGVLYGEFPQLFKSLFNASELNLRIVKEIATHRYGIEVSKLLQKTGKSSGGRFKNRLAELEATGFIQRFLPFGRNKRDRFYKVIDEYTLFYLKWIEKIVEEDVPIEDDYWGKVVKSASWFSWAGYAFENICYKHVHNIIYALGLSGIRCFPSQWRYSSALASIEDRGAQIDLVLDREDDAITLCEIKYTMDPFSIDKEIALDFMRKLDVFKQQTKTQKQVFLALVSAAGLKENVWSQELLDGKVNLDDLFKEKSSAS